MTVTRAIERVLSIALGIVVGVGIMLLLCAVPPTTTQAVAPATVRRSLDTCTIPQAVAHRGGWADSGKTENTLGAYNESYKYGLLEWETDIRWDAAGVPVLMHDATIDRTTQSSGNIADITVAGSTIKMNDGTYLRDQTLANLLASASAKGATVAIEPKAVATSTQVGAVGALLNTYGMRDRVLLDSFSTANLQPFKDRMPDLTYGLVSADPLPVADVLAVGPIYNVGYANLTQQWVDDYHAAGIKVYSWTQDTPAQWAPQRMWGVDRVVTNKPATYRSWRSWTCSGDAWVGEY